MTVPPIRWLLCAAAALSQLASPVRAQDVPIDSFAVGGFSITIAALKAARVRIRADSNGIARGLVVRALDLDNWIAGARLALMRESSTDTLREPTPDSGARAAMRIRLAPRGTPARLELRGRDGEHLVLPLGPILSARLLESLLRASDRAHTMFAGIGTDAPPPMPRLTAGPPCAERMEQLHQSRGYPEHYSKYDDGAYHSEEWSYENGARTITFTWHDGEPGCKITSFQAH